jgi:hypothetical protein
MSANAKPDQFRLGFLTAVEVPEQGYVGGLLVTNRHGRPLEFQCTAPVKPNRTQEILYGPTLTPFVLGELIGRALVEKAGVKPHLILTEREEILELRNHVPMPVACLDEAQASSPASETPSPEPGTDAAKKTGEKLKLGKQWVRLHAAHDTDRPTIEQDAHQVPHTADLREPFERVREALRETLKSGALR